MTFVAKKTQNCYIWQRFLGKVTIRNILPQDLFKNIISKMNE